MIGLVAVSGAMVLGMDDAEAAEPGEIGYKFTVGDLVYEVIADGEVEVANTVTEDLAGELLIPSMISDEMMNYVVTSIGNMAIMDCSYLTSISIPDGVSYIGNYAFSGCSSLTSITIPDSVSFIDRGAFFDCTDLTSVTIPEGVGSIGDNTFERCTSLTSVTIPGSVTSIGSDAFASCSRLTSVIIPESVTFIGDGAFNGCVRITSITIPEGITCIGEDVFNACVSLRSITIPASVTSINSRAFYNDSIKSITFEGDVPPVIASDAFSKGRTINVTTPGWDPVAAFADTLDESITIVWANAPSLTIGDQFTIGDLIYEVIADGEVEVADTVSTEIGGELTISSSVSYGMTSYTVSSIGNKAFEYCVNLESIVFPDSVTSIESYAFDACLNLTSVTFESETAPSFGDFSFWTDTNILVYTPGWDPVEAMSDALWMCGKTTVTWANPPQYPDLSFLSTPSSGLISYIGRSAA